MYSITLTGGTPTQWDYGYIYEKLKLFHRITIRDTDVNVLLHYWWYLGKKCLGKLFHKSNIPGSATHDFKFDSFQIALHLDAFKCMCSNQHGLGGHVFLLQTEGGGFDSETNLTMSKCP